MLYPATRDGALYTILIARCLLTTPPCESLAHVDVRDRMASAPLAEIKT